MATPSTTTPHAWTKNSWRNFPVAQSVVYPAPPSPNDPHSASSTVNLEAYKQRQSLEQVVQKLETLPPLVSPVEIERLKASLAKVAKGEAFLLQGGDCAGASFVICSLPDELVSSLTVRSRPLSSLSQPKLTPLRRLRTDCNSTQIEHRLSLLLSMSLILIWGLKLPVIRVARMGGQFAKPRSSPTETIISPSTGESITLPSFRGDNVNGYSPDDRTPDPERLLLAYFHSSATINHVRTLLSTGFASLPNEPGVDVPWSLELEHVRSRDLLERYEGIVRSLSDALEFLKVVGGGSGGKGGVLESADIFLSHEALLLEYESALTRELPVPGFAKVDEDDKKGFYCTSAHFIWIGDRTRSITGAHVEFFRGLRNPIGIKVGPSMDPEELVRLLDIVDPKNEEGRVTLICRYGADKVEKMLPGHIKAVRGTKHPVIWSCDPMHGNTKSIGSIKTRPMNDIVSEISASIRIHNSFAGEGAQRLGLGGIHLELTADIEKETGFSVTECIGGSMELGEEELGLRYQSFCDPRLNFEQSLDIAFLLSEQFEAARRGRSGKDVAGDVILTGLSGSRPVSKVREN